MVKFGWTASEVTREHLQNLTSHGYMTVAELATCRVLGDPTSLASMGAYVMACAAFYEKGFGVPPHRFSALYYSSTVWGLSPIFIHGTTSSAPGYNGAWTWNRQH
jgi:hypothetical protein